MGVPREKEKRKARGWALHARSEEAGRRRNGPHERKERRPAGAGAMFAQANQ